MWTSRRVPFFLGIVGLGLLSAAAGAEPVSDHVLADVSVSEKAGCAIVTIRLNQRVQYLNHFAPTGGDELRITLSAIDRAATARRPDGMREALRAPQNELASIFAIELESSGKTDTLTVYFKRGVAARVAQGGDFRSIHFSVSKPQASAGCQPALEAAAANTAPAAMIDQQGAGGKAPDGAALPPAGDPGKLLSEARAAFEKKNYDRAVKLLSKLLEGGESKDRQEAQELLGLSRELRGQLAHARAEYKEYLRLYPKGAGADRVRQRLAQIEEGAMPAGDGLAGGVAKDPNAPGQGKVVLDDKGLLRGTLPPAGEGTHLVQQQAPPEWTYSAFGSASIFYNLNQGGRSFIELPRTDLGWSREDPYKTYQNSLLENFDFDARFDNAAYAGRFRFSGSQQNDFTGSSVDETRVATLLLESRFKDSGATTRIGRQTSTSGGALGRFDGIQGSYRFSDTIGMNAIGGSPVERASDLPFIHERYFFGVSADASWFSKSLDTTLYAIEERSEDFLDRRAVGLEVRHSNNGQSLYGAAEYDIHFNDIKSALLNGSKIFDDRSVASLQVDYRRAPTLQLSNALMGQWNSTLAELFQRYSVSEIDQLALDRTARSFTATLSYSRPIYDWLQWNGDITMSRLSGMPASGGIDAVPSPGADYFASSQLVASGIFREGDTVSGALRYAYGPIADRYLAEVSMSYPITPTWRVSPLMQVGYMTYKTEQREDYQLMPSIRSFYKVYDNTTFELELGGKLIESNSATLGKALQQELLVLAGVRYDFDQRGGWGIAPKKEPTGSRNGVIQLGNFVVSASAGHMWGVANEIAYNPDGSKLSQLTWRTKGAAVTGGGIDWMPVDWFSMGVRGRTNMSGRSLMDDSDFGIIGCPDMTCYSYHEDTSLVRMYALDASAAVTLPVSDLFSVSALAGYRWDSSHWQARNGVANYGELPTGLGIEYEQWWQAPYLGVAAKATLGRFALGGKVTYSPWVQAHDEDHHVWTNTIFTDAFKGGGLLDVTASLDYALTDTWRLSLEYDYRRYALAKGSTTTNYYLWGIVVETEGNVAGADSTTQTLSVGVSKTF